MFIVGKKSLLQNKKKLKKPFAKQNKTKLLQNKKKFAKKN